MVTRRAFLKSSGIGLFGVGLLGGIPSFLADVVAEHKRASLYSKRKVLVCIFQRGAMDGLMAVTPFDDKYLQAARPDLYVGPSLVQGKGASIDLDGRFSLHSSLSPLERLFREERLAIVHGIGSPNTTRSHFDAQDYMESGTPFEKNTTSGWLNRAVGLLGHEALTPFSAVSMTPSLPRSFYGQNNALAIQDLKNFKVQERASLRGTAKSFEELYEETSSSLLRETSKESFEAMKLLRSDVVKNYTPAKNVRYPVSNLGKSLKQVAQLIKLDVGLEVAFTESNGWDTHYNQGGPNGSFARNAEDLAQSIASFWEDIDGYQDEVVLMTMTEFGRTVHQNGTKGTDHGRASCNFILGNYVDGGKVYGDVPVLTTENLEDGRDLPVTTDFRAVFAGVAHDHLQLQDADKLFPGYTGDRFALWKK